MSFNKLDNLYDELQNIINDTQNDVTKFVEGNNSAGTRVRKAMQAVKSLAQEVRVEVQDQKNAQFQNILKTRKGVTKVTPFFYINIFGFTGCAPLAILAPCPGVVSIFPRKSPSV